MKLDLGSVTGPMTKAGDMFGWMKSLFGGLGYFVGGDFQKALGKGFMA